MAQKKQSHQQPLNWFGPGNRAGYRVTIAADWGPLWLYEDLMRRDPLAVYGDLLPVLRDSDLNIVNVECALGDRGAPIIKCGPCLRGDEDAGIAALTGVPFHVASLSNNHIMDYGPEGLEHTIHVLRRAGLRTVGAGMDGEEAARPLVIEADGFRLGIINCGEGEACASLDNGPGANVFDVERQEAEIRALKATTDAVLVIFHGGRELASMPPPYVVNGLRRLAEAGAAAVIAHHPHVPQGLEVHHGVPIAYSQGNFVFYNEGFARRYYASTGYLAHLDFDGKKLAAVSLTPYRIKKEGLSALAGDERRTFLEELRELSGHLADAGDIADLWDAFADEYGGNGERALRQQIEGAVEEYRKSPAQAWARFHNYAFAPAHREYFLRSFQRLRQGTFGDSPAWAREVVRRWTTREI